MKCDLSVPAALIAERMGLQFTEDRWPELARGIERAGASLGFESMHAFITHLLGKQFGQRETQALAAHLTIGETHFFRSVDTYGMLQSWLLPELVAARQNTTRTLRLWSAGCAAGQEPYSLAILLASMLGKLDTWDITILATDINPEVVTAAKTAEYTQWSFRGTPSWVVNGYFTKTRDARYRLDPVIRDMVTFRYLNLAEDVYPAVASGVCDFDLIMCRNVIMYFSRDMTIKVTDRLQQSLREGGVLLLTPSESSREVQHGLTPLTLGGEVVYRKMAHSESADRVHARVAAAPVQSKTVKKPRRSHSEVGPAASSAPRLRLERRSVTRVEPTDGQVDPMQAGQEARMLADRGELAPALERCDTALAADKLNPFLYYLKAGILLELGQSDAAERALQSTLFLDGSFAPARVMLGAIARGQSRPGEAAKHFGAALALLEKMPSDAVVPETDGLTAGKMAETVASLMGSEFAL